MIGVKESTKQDAILNNCSAHIILSIGSAST